MHFPGQPWRFMNLVEHETMAGYPSILGCYQGMVKLRDYLQQKGFEYRIFDSEKLNPTEGTEFIRSMCEFAGLPFNEAMMQTKSSHTYPEDWWIPPTISMLNDPAVHGHDWHGTACKSSTLEPIRTISEGPENELTEEDKAKLEQIKNEVMPLYMQLKKEII